MNQLPDIHPLSFTLSATIIGYALIDHFKSTEQNAIGNWLMLIGQILCTNGSYQFHKEYQAPTPKSNAKDIDLINRTIDAMKEEIEKLKKYNN